MQIQHQYDTQQGGFFIEQHGRRVAELSYRTLNQHTLDVYRTFVDVNLRGQGIADKLYRALMVFVDQNGYQVRPSCHYIASKMQREKRVNAVEK